MNELISQIKELKSSPVREIINSRINEFGSIPRNFNSLFRELAFCILTAGTSAELGIRTINHLGNTLLLGSQEEIQEKLKEVYRFHTIRAGYLHKAREDFKKINMADKNIREQLVEKIKGIGMKEASHFLRNVGYLDFAIIDFHIMDILADNKLIDKPKTLTEKKYLEIENVLKNLANRLNISLGELDLYLWYLETGKILK